MWSDLNRWNEGITIARIGTDVSATQVACDQVLITVIARVWSFV